MTFQPQNTFAAILGRQPELGRAELESLLGADRISPVAENVVIFTTSSDEPLNINRLGGSKKLCKIVDEATRPSRLDTLHIAYRSILDPIYSVSGTTGARKVTLGISAVNSELSTQDLQKLGLKVKNACKKQGISLRLLPNSTPELSTATAHHNKLGLKPNAIEFLIIDAEKSVLFGASTGAQNITAYAARDQKRPARDAKVGMLPPKLAQIIVNLAAGQSDARGNLRLLDPFCGTGVILQEAALMGFRTYGTDLEPRMIDYSRQNLDFLAARMNHKPIFELESGDATKFHWQPPIDLVASETYLGQPFSAPPSDMKLREVKHTCTAIIRAYLRNLGGQIKPRTRICLAIPAWRQQNELARASGDLFSRINPLDLFDAEEYNLVKFRSQPTDGLLYYREDQVVARELLVLIKK